MAPYSDLLNPEKALIFRITHRDKVPWLLENGIHAKNRTLADPNFRSIGNAKPAFHVCRAWLLSRFSERPCTRQSAT